MKVLYTSLDELDMTLDRVWDACLSNVGFFKAHPAKGIIEVYEDLGNNQSRQIAEIRIKKIASLSDLSDIFKS